MASSESEKRAAKKYASAHPERVAKAQRKWRDENKEKFNAYMREWRLKHPGYQALQDKKYREKNLIKRRLSEAHKTRRRRSIEGSFTWAEWEEKKEAFYNTCPACGAVETAENLLTIDHIVPTIKGGTNFISNLQPLCPRCNFRKYTKVIEYTPWQASAT